MFFILRLNVCLLTLLICLPAAAQDEVDVRVTSWQSYLKVHSQWQEARQQHALLVAEHAHAVLQWESEKDNAERELLVHQYELKAYREGLREVRLTALKNEVVVITERVKQADVRRSWSVKLANRGLISQKELEADEIAVERLNGQLKTKKEELKQEQQEQGSVRETELLTALEQATTKLEIIRQDGAKGKSEREEVLKQQMILVKSLQGELQKSQAEFKRLREFLETQESNASSQKQNQQILQLEQELKTSEQAVIDARTQSDDRMAQWQSRLDSAKQVVLQFKNTPEGSLPRSVAIQNQEAAVQSAQEKVNQSIQNETWANRVLKKGFITQVLYEKYSLQLLEARLDLALQQQRFAVESSLRAMHEAVLREFDLQVATREVAALSELLRLNQAYSKTLIERHREHANRQQAVISVLKLIPDSLGD
ncbi:MAG: hypothetical protein MKZ94_04840 [Pirellulales bacterium]|nr:hypothetical protein [Pirellulales bacterium]